MTDHPNPQIPQIVPAGYAACLVRFAATLSEPANRAALAFAAHMERDPFAGIEEVSPALTSVLIQFDPRRVSYEDTAHYLRAVLDAQDWYQAAQPGGARHWRIPCSFDGPQLSQAATAVGLSDDQARAELAAASVQVLTLGFAPGQPYMGQLAPHWNVPRQTELTQQVPKGALVLAIRQLIIFTMPTPTGWWHVGQTAFECFRADDPDPFALRPGDTVSFDPVDRDVIERLSNSDTDGNGGAICVTGL